MTPEIKSMIEKTMENLRRNNIKPYFVETKEDVLPLVKTLINEGDTVSKPCFRDTLRTQERCACLRL